MGYVYVLQFPNRIKIGFTTNFQQRKRQIETASGEQVQNSFFIEAPKSVEATAHSMLKEYRLIGEYFNIDFDYGVSVVNQANSTITKTVSPSTISPARSTADKIVLACQHTNTSQKALALAIGVSPANFTQKLKVGKFKQNELLAIANALGCSFRPCAFVFDDVTIE